MFLVVALRSLRTIVHITIIATGIIAFFQCHKHVVAIVTSFGVNRLLLPEMNCATGHHTRQVLCKNKLGVLLETLAALGRVDRIGFVL